MSLAAAANARQTPDAVALADERTALTWTQLDTVLNRGVNALLARGAAPDGRAAVFAHNSAEAMAAYLSAMLAGVSSVPVNFHLTAEEVAYILTDAGADTLFVGPETLEAGRAAAALAGVGRIVAWRSPAAPGVIAWDTWLAEASAAEPPENHPPRPHLHYTSGTTGRPKGAETPPNMLPRLETIGAVAEALRAQRATVGDRSPVLVIGPLYHTGPLGAVRQLAAGSAVIVQSRFDPEAALKAIQTYRVKSSVMVPTHFQRFLALPPEVRARYDVSSLVAVSHTGAACPPEVKRAMIGWFGPVLIEAYGATESGTTNTITSEEWLRKPGSVGLTVAPFEPVVVAEDGTRLGPGQTGQLYFRDTGGRGIVYHNDPAKTAAAHIEPGVFTLGDVGHVDEDGYVFITDRVSDMIVSGGVNIYPAEAEQALLQHPAVADVAVIGAPNADMGEEVKALVMLRDPASPPDVQALDRFCRERLAGYKCPRSYEFVADLGRNAMGKINKRELRRPYWPTDRTIGG